MTCLVLVVEVKTRWLRYESWRSGNFSAVWTAAFNVLEEGRTVTYAAVVAYYGVVTYFTYYTLQLFIIDSELKMLLRDYIASFAIPVYSNSSSGRRRTGYS
jgi:hypothetical protein